jgi:SsrA-binding protein
MPKKNTTNNKPLATNKKAYSDYNILEKYEAGVKLTGAEVKSVKGGKINLKASYVVIGSDLTPYIIGAHIAKYEQAGETQLEYDPTRSRILLLNKKQIKSLYGKLKEKRLSLVPLSVYSKSGIIKFEIALATGKKKFEKRDSIKKRDIERDVGRKLRR